MPFFRTYVFHLDDASRERDCPPSDFACDILMHKDGTHCPAEDSEALQLAPPPFRHGEADHKRHLIGG